jgi:prepilin-type N-terminal cleavage/methylation domain-containing protein
MRTHPAPRCSLRRGSDHRFARLSLKPGHRHTPKPPQLNRRPPLNLVRPAGHVRAFALATLRSYARAFTLPKLRGRSTLLSCRAVSSRRSTTKAEVFIVDGFTLLELLVVIAVVSILMVVIAPAFTGINSAGDVASAAYTIKGVLEQARTFAMANDTYTWVGFFEEDAGTSIPAILGNGRLVISAVASTDGTNVYGSGTGTLDPTKLIQIGKLVKISNVHLPLFQVGSGTGDTFDTRPAVQNDPTGGYNYSRFGELNNPAPNTAPYTTPYNFQYPVGNPAPAPQYTFKKILQFNSRGEARVNGDMYDVRRVVEIGLIATHGNAVPTAVTGAGTSTATYNGNAVALQIVGFGADIKVYRR